MKLKSILAAEKTTIWILWVVFGLLLFFASLAWFERMNTDAGYYLFKTINKRFFYIEHGRYVLAIAEILPLVAVWLHLPLKIVVVLYSLNHVLFFALAALVCYKIEGKTQSGLGISILAFCGLRDSVFTPQFELYYGLVFLIVFIVFLNYCFQKNKFTIANLFLLAILVAFAVTSHPMGLLCCLFVLCLNEIYNKRFLIKLWGTVILACMLYYFWKKANVSDYEGAKFAAFFDALRSVRLGEIMQWKALSRGLKGLIVYYPDVALFFIFGVVFWWKTNKWIGLPMYIMGVFFFLLSVWLVWNPDSQINRYLEQVYYPFVFSAFVFAIWVSKQRVMLLCIVVFSIFFRIYSVQKGYQKYHARTVFMDSLLRHVHDGQRKVVTKNEMGDENYQMADWSYGFETMIRSKIILNKTISITKDEDILFQKNDSLLKDDEYLFRMWEREKTSTLNKDYFHFKDGKYRQLFTDKK